MNRETFDFWNLVKNHLPSDCLEALATNYPEIKKEASQLQARRMRKEAADASFIADMSSILEIS